MGVCGTRHGVAGNTPGEIMMGVAISQTSRTETQYLHRSDREIGRLLPGEFTRGAFPFGASPFLGWKTWRAMSGNGASIITSLIVERPG